MTLIHLAHEAANVLIVLGYLFLAAVIAPNLDVRYWYTKVGGALFFLCCAFTHAVLTIRSHFGLYEEITGNTWWWSLNHVVQAAAVVAFVYGLFTEWVSIKTAHKVWTAPPTGERIDGEQ